MQLRKLLQDTGLRDLEREATYSIERGRTSAQIALKMGWMGFFAGIFRWLAFDLTTAYGLQPFRALLIIVGLWFLFIPVYCWPIGHDPGQSPSGGIYQVFPANWIGESASGQPRIEKEPVVLRVQAENLWNAVPSAVYFSLLSAVNIGFEQFTPGDWIRRLQRHEYALQAEGWVRPVAGAQALLSVFLLAMWALTQFGRPFQ